VRQRIPLVVLSLTLLMPSLQAQQQVAPGSGGHVFTVTLLKVPQGQISDFIDFWEKEFTPLERQIPQIVSSKVLQHRWGPADYTVFIIHEYKDLASIDAAQRQQEGAIQERAKTDPHAAETMKKFTTFVSGHVDYIMFSPDRVRKFNRGQD
jgi:hypothetical protein